MLSPSSNREIVYMQLTEDHIEEAAQILTIALLNGEPLSGVVKQPYNAELALNRMICFESAQDGVSVVAIDKELNKVIGVSSGKIMAGTNTKTMLDDLPLFPEEVRPYYAVFAPLAAKLEECLFESPDIRNNPYCKILKSDKIGVHPDYRGFGIATKMADTRRSLAEQKGLKFILVVASAIGSQKLYRKLGYNEIGEVVYKEYMYKDGKPLAGITSPPSAKAMVLQLF